MLSFPFLFISLTKFLLELLLPTEETLPQIPAFKRKNISTEALHIEHVKAKLQH